MLNIGILISGGGSNLQAIIDEIEAGNIDGQISLIISNREDAYGLERGRKAGIESIFLDPKAYGTNEGYNLKIVEEFEKRKIGLVVLAGYLRILSKDFIEAYRNRIINIHPSLIPSFCGDGFFGEKVHQAIIDQGCKISGATVHFVDEGTDTGPIILQEAVEVKDDDKPEDLGKRVLEVEHRILPRAVKLFCENKIIVEGRRTRIGGRTR